MPYIGKVPAAVPIDTSDIPDNSIDASKIIDGSIEAADISAGSITADKLNATLDLSSKTVTLPAASVTAHATNPTKTSIEALSIELPAANLTGTIADARISHGTTANKFVRLTASGKLPAIDGSDLTNLPAGGVAGISSSADATAITITSAEKVGIGVTTPTARLDLGALTSNTPGGSGLLKLGDHQFRQMTSGEDETLCLDRDMNGTPAVSMAWRPNTGDVGINTIPGAAAKLIIKSGSLTQAQLKFFGVNYSYGSEMMHQNGSESGTVGNTRGWYKHDIVTLGNTRRFWTAASQVGSDYQYWSTNNTERFRITNDGRGVSQFTARAWINLNGTGSISISDSHNISSVSDNATGRYDINIDTNMSNANYVVTSGGGGGITENNIRTNSWIINSGQFRLLCKIATTGGAIDISQNLAAVFGD